MCCKLPDHGCNSDRSCTFLCGHIIMRGFLGRTRYEEYIFAVSPAPLTGRAALLIHISKSVAMILAVRLGQFLTHISSEAQIWVQAHDAVRQILLSWQSPNSDFWLPEREEGFCTAHESSGSWDAVVSVYKAVCQYQARGHSQVTSTFSRMFVEAVWNPGAWFYTPKATHVSSTPYFHSFVEVPSFFWQHIIYNNILCRRWRSKCSCWLLFQNSVWKILNAQKNPLTVWDHIHTAGLLFGGISFLVGKNKIINKVFRARLGKWIKTDSSRTISQRKSLWKRNFSMVNMLGKHFVSTESLT